MRYEHTILIDAPASVVWDLTSDIERWPDHTPTMRRVEALDPVPLEPGGRARVKQPMQPEAVWTVTEVEPGARFAWRTERGGMAMTASHLIEDLGGGRCRNTLTVETSGSGAGLFKVLFGPAVRWALTRENRGFKRAAEQVSG